MFTTSSRPATGVLAATALLTGLLISPMALAQVAGAAAGISDAASAAADQADATLNLAASLLDSGKAVQAKAVLARLLIPSVEPTLTDAQRDRIVKLSRGADDRTRQLSVIEVSLQKAEQAVAEGDLRTADRQARAVLGKPASSEDERERARAVLAGVKSRQGEVAPLIDGMIEQAGRDLDAGRYVSAKGSLNAVLRTGIELNAQQQRALDQYQMKVLDVERQRGLALGGIDTDAAMGLFQPGTVRRGGQPGNPAPAPAPEPAPAATPAAPAAAQPEPTPAPAPAAQPEPAAQPAPPSQPAGGEDLIQAALRAEAQRVFAEAEYAFQEKRYNEAITKYTLSLQANRQYLSAEQLATADARLAEARDLSNRNAPGKLVGDTVGNISVVRQRTQAMFENEMDQAGKALQAGDTAKATELAARARLTAGNASSVFSEAENAAFKQRVDALLQQISVTAEQVRQREATETERKLREDKDALAKTNREQKERKIAENIDRIRALQQEQKYEEALQVVDQVLFLDPTNPTGLLLRDALFDVTVFKRYWDSQRRKAANVADYSLHTEEDMILPRTLMEYPPDWPKKSFDRGELAAYADGPEDRRVLAELNTRKIPVDFKDNTVADVLSFLETVTQVNIDVDWDSLGQIGVTRDSLVSLKLTNVPVRVALDRVLEKVSKDQYSRANWSVNDGILMVASDEALRKQTSLVIYNITDLLLEIPNYYDAPEIDLQGVLQQGQGGGGGRSPFRDNQQNQRNQEELAQRRRDRITQIMDLIRTHVDFEGWRDNGGETGTMQELNGSLIVRNTPRNHREIVGLLSKLREIRAMQINIETKFLLVQQDWFEQIGFDVDVVINANNNQFRAARAVDPTVQTKDFFNFNGDAPAGRGLQRNVTGQEPTGGTTAPGTRTTQGLVNPRSWSPIGAIGDSLGLTNGLAASSVRDDSLTAQVLKASPALGIAGQFLDDVQVDFLITATQADRRSVQLTAPRLTITNGQTANIYVVTQQAFVSELEPVVGDSAVGFDPTVSVANEGVTMLVEGVISSDRRYVTMNIDAGVSRIDGFGQEPVTAVAGGQLVNSADTQSFIQLPTVTVTKVATTATVPDEGTVLLGGQRLVTEVEIETGVPVLSKIPIINRFFTNRLTSKEEQTLLVLVKPTIMILTEQEEKSFPGLNDAMRTGLGLR